MTGISNKKAYYPAFLCRIAAVWVCVLLLGPVTAEESETAPTTPQASASEKEPNDPNTPPLTAEEAGSADPNQPTAEENGGSMLPNEGDVAELYRYFGLVFNKGFVSDEGLVDYGALRRRRSDLLNAVRILENLHPAVLMSMGREERIAFWINTYNTCTVKLIIDNYPIQPKWYMILYPNNSIMQITGAWDKVFFKIMGLEYNLREIRNDLLLNRYKDPRICFALTDAARGGAMLRNEPILPATLNEQLDDQVRRYLISPVGFRRDEQNNAVILSNIFAMNKTVFVTSEYAEILKFRSRKPDERAWLNFLYKYLPPAAATWLDSSDPAIRFMNFDWLLNEK
jgi:hypothetical protein